MSGFKIKVPDSATKVLSDKPKRVQALLQQYGQAISRSRTAGRRVSFRVDVDPEGDMVVTPVEDEVLAAPTVAEHASTADAGLEQALAAARARGRSKAAEILERGDMLSADEFARLLGTTRVTINTKRQNGQVLGLDGAKRGYRFPDWQLDFDGKPFAALSILHERLGGAWAVYRFLVQPHGELDGLTGREALERGRTEEAISAAESVGRDFR
ncbi:XRE family transcriptional regulator [Rhizobium grahamii]|uniref:XRE family transcriptional regulator n=1 Tax=Rhizobium grahamii TaxID=1120045 RepID=A0A370KGX3_9HYPH|nr:XRE family transcriptional regulator [Rhizobium grahamii]RDJ04028.1 XRE family transcriptional regulator [Rhizobium grahamii]